jgi:hypothetical protein
LETTGKMGRQGSLVCRVSLGGQDLWGLRETRVSLETRGLRDRQEFQDPRVNGEILARMEKLGGEALQDLMDLLERMAPLAVQDLGASRACLDLEAKTDLPVLMVALGCRELWVWWAMKESGVVPDSLAREDRQGGMDPLDQGERMDHKDPMVLLVHLDQKEVWDTRDQQVL